jgi:hypothetical protein
MKWILGMLHRLVEGFPTGSRRLPNIWLKSIKWMGQTQPMTKYKVPYKKTAQVPYKKSAQYPCKKTLSLTTEYDDKWNRLSQIYHVAVVEAVRIEAERVLDEMIALHEDVDMKPLNQAG